MYGNKFLLFFWLVIRFILMCGLLCMVCKVVFIVVVCFFKVYGMGIGMNIVVI